MGLGLNLFFIRLLEQRPALFQDGVRIDSVYGCFPACDLNGGRAFLRERATPRQMEEAFSLLAEHGVKARLTLTNMLADEDDLRDEYLNAMLAIAGRYDAEAIVYADLVGNYVRERYGMRCVLSTTRALADAAEVNRMTKRYDYVVLDYNRHKDPAFLAALEDRDKVEVMVNEFCAYQCPNRRPRRGLPNRARGLRVLPRAPQVPRRRQAHGHARRGVIVGGEELLVLHGVRRLLHKNP